MRKHKLAECENCPLQGGKGAFVPSVGNKEAKVAVIGEAPGVVEAQQGRPFVGPSGKLLNLVLRHQGIKRSELLLTNACLCRPIDGSTPPKSAIASCRPRLLAELEGIGIETALALGNSASEALLGISGVTKLRIGPGRPSRYLPNVHVISTIHPAACLRQGDMFPFLVTDIGKVKRAKRNVWFPPTYITAETPEEALLCLQFLRQKQGPIAVDIEAGIEKDTSHDHPNRYQMLCIGVGWSNRKAVIFGEYSFNNQVWTELGSYLRSRPIVGQNYKFDGAGLYPHIGATEAYFDTMLASYCFDERPGIHGLKSQAAEYLGAPHYDTEIKQYVGKGRSYANIPRPILYRYNAYDVVCTYDLFHMYEARFAEPGNEGLRRVHDLLVAASNQLMFVELNGIAIDRDYLKVLTKEYSVNLEKLRADIQELVGHEINPNSPKQVQEQLLRYRIRVQSTDKDTLTRIIERTTGKTQYSTATTFCQLLLKHRREAKLFGTYIKGVEKRLYRGRVYPTFMLHSTTTGRTSCRNPNIQNVPRESSMRKLYIPAKEGNVFVQVDYAQAELRVLTFLAQEGYFQDIFNAGDRDLFDDLTPVLYRTANKATMSPAEWKELRIRVKAYVYGLSYGREAKSIADEYGLSVPEAVRGMQAFFSVIPSIVKFREETRASVLAGKYLETPFGRRRRFGLITMENNHEIMNEALAFKPQSTASDMCVQAFTWARRKLRGTAFIRNIVHDSILAECTPEDAETVAGELDALMVQSARTIVGDYVKFATDFKVGRNWGEV